MKNNFDSEGFFFLVLSFIFCATIFLGIRKFAANAFKNTPMINSVETKRQINKQKERLDKLKRDQETLMRNRKQKIQDSRR